MRVLVLAPQPFYQERGTPIAVRLAVETLAKKFAQSLTSPERQIDLLVYNEGDDIEMPGVRVMRVTTPEWLCGVRPGISLKKLACDVLFTIHSFALLWRTRKNRYDVIHAVEESVFIAWIAKKLFGIPYIYDMDSSLALQLTEKWWWCRPALYALQCLEGVAIRGSVSVAPVCDALQAIALRCGSASTIMLRDVSLLPASVQSQTDRSTLFGTPISDRDRVVLYVGNLEAYQGIDLLLESFSHIYRDEQNARLVIVGGPQEAINRYSEKTLQLGCSDRVVFTGPRPVHDLSKLLTAADILVSPRIKGNNTPMKIYSYLHSGTVLLATDLPTHQQVVTASIAMLAKPSPESFGDALRLLLRDDALRKRLGAAAKHTAEKLYTVEAFESQLGTLYDTVAARIGALPIDESSQVQNI
jgi:glycosyltransferase involved in cell wall biosynthesis